MVRTSNPILYPCITIGYNHNHYGINFNITVSYTPRISGKNWLFKTFPILKSSYSSLRAYGTYLTHHPKYLNPRDQQSWVRTIFSGQCIAWVNNKQTRYLTLDKYNVRSAKARASVLKIAIVFLSLCWQMPNVRRLQDQDQDGLARKLSTNVYDIYHCWVYSE